MHFPVFKHFQCPNRQFPSSVSALSSAVKKETDYKCATDLNVNLFSERYVEKQLNLVKKQTSILLNSSLQLTVTSALMMISLI
jgi:hypothetical protein